MSCGLGWGLGEAYDVIFRILNNFWNLLPILTKKFSKKRKSAYLPKVKLTAGPLFLSKKTLRGKERASKNSLKLWNLLILSNKCLFIFECKPDFAILLQSFFLSIFFHWHTAFISFYFKKARYKSTVPINTLLIAAVINIKIM